MNTNEVNNERKLDTADAIRFMFAGNAKFTVRNTKTGNRFTFRVSEPKKKTSDASVHFVSVLAGPDNTADYTFLGTIFGFETYKHSKKSSATADAQSVKVFTWVFERLKTRTLPEFIEIWHMGHCGRCGRELTVPESIQNGIGPECAKLMQIGSVASDDENAKWAQHKADFAQREAEQERAAFAAKFERTQQAIVDAGREKL
jgi:Family of unknown function (DUF6011)